MPVQPRQISRERAAFHQWLRDCLCGSRQYLIWRKRDEARGKIAFSALALKDTRPVYSELFWQRHGAMLRREFPRALNLEVVGHATPRPTSRPTGRRPGFRKEHP